MHRKLAAVLCIFSLSLVLLASAAVPTVASNTESSLVVLAADWMRVEPQAEVWPLVVTIFSTKQVEDVKLQVKVEGRNITSTIRRCPEATLPVNLVSGISTAALRRFVSVARQQLVENIPAVDLREFAGLSAVVMRQSRELMSVLLEIPTDKLPMHPQDGQEYDIMLWADSSAGADAVVTKVLVSSLPKETGWTPAELHTHSKVSDNPRFTIEQAGRIYQNLGYRALYMTDHLDGVARYSWPKYVADTDAAQARSNISVFPGVEVTTAYGKPDDEDPNGTDDDADDPDDDADNASADEQEPVFSGDLLAYGLRSLNGLARSPISPEYAIQAVQANNPPQSSSAIAHPCRPGYGWGNWTLNGYSGIEVMSGWQFQFGPNSKPFKRWVADLNRQLPSTFSSGYFPAARAGGDWHGYLNPRSYITWINTGGHTSAEAVNKALHGGETVASRFGGLAMLTVDLGGQEYGIGDFLPPVEPGSKLKVGLELHTVMPGEYELGLYQNDQADPVLKWDLQAKSGETVTMEGGIVYPSGQRCYYLVVTGADFICTSPVFIGR